MFPRRCKIGTKYARYRYQNNILISVNSSIPIVYDYMMNSQVLWYALVNKTNIGTKLFRCGEFLSKAEACKSLSWSYLTIRKIFIPQRKKIAWRIPSNSDIIHIIQNTIHVPCNTHIHIHVHVFLVFINAHEYYKYRP